MPLKEVTEERVLLARAARAAVTIYLSPLRIVIGTSVQRTKAQSLEYSQARSIHDLGYGLPGRRAFSEIRRRLIRGG
jgi:hypothetical protein